MLHPQVIVSEDACVHLRTADADELASVVVAGLPRRSLLGALGGYRVPDRVTDASDGLCPRCGRRLVCSLGPLGEGGVMIPRSRRELLGACLVDGPRRVHARSFPPDAIVEAALVVADGLAAVKWSPWTRAIRRALDEAGGSWPPVEAAGQALEAVRAFGPMASALDQPPAALDALDALEVLVTSSGPYWLDCRSRPSDGVSRGRPRG
jgi:hypothetical protein